ncbi:MAG: YdcF family protein [Bacteroidota bacterium]
MSRAVVDAYDVAIILGARLRDDGTPSPALARRVGHGVGLVRDGQARALLMTGGTTSGTTSGAIAEAWVMRDLALAAGVPENLVQVEDRARNTIQNALFSAPLIQAAGWRRVLVVTDSFHRLRTRYIFRRFGLAVAVAGVRPDRPSAQWWLAHLREAAALPWTMLRVEARRLRVLP